MKGRRLLLAYAVACAASCSSGAAPIDGGATIGYTKIDDMEEASPYPIEWTPPLDLAPGTWYTATGCGAEGNVLPPPGIVVAGAFVHSVWSYAVLPEAHETFPGTMSKQAARVRTTAPLNGVWGANMSLVFAFSGDGSGQIVPTAGSDACPIVIGAEAAVDLSAYAGVTFWAKGDPAGARTVQVMFLDSHTDARGGFCNYIDPNSPDFCYNGFTASIALTDTFSRYTIDFASLRQDPNWGYRANPDVLDVQHVYQIVFQITAPTCYTDEMCAGGAPPPVSFDIWIDDLYFVNK
ncbi:MAG: hypothetical protein ABUS79_16235 [Pseudomonadota bacterium]